MRHTLIATVIVLVTLFGCSVSAQHAHRHDIKGYRIGQNVTFECMEEGRWVPGPACTETGEPMAFTYGVESFASCGWHIKDEKMYEFLASLIRRDLTWNCRVAMVPDVPEGHDWYVPFTIPVWGVVEKDHMHIDNHLFFVFHAAAGRILGATSYPVRNRLQFGKPGSVVTMHGPIKWFNGHTFLPFSSASRQVNVPSDLGSTVFVAVCCVLTLMLSALGFTFLYKFYLRKRLVQKMLKKD